MTSLARFAIGWGTTQNKKAAEGKKERHFPPCTPTN